MDKVTIHRYECGRHPAGGKYQHFVVVSGPKPFGPRGGKSGRWVDGKNRGHFWKLEQAREFAQFLVEVEDLELVV